MSDIIKMVAEAGSEACAEGGLWVGSDAAIQRFADLIRADQQAEIEMLRKSLTWIATVNAMDYEYQSVARAALAARPGGEKT